MRRDFCLPLVGGDPLCEMASRLLMQVGEALTRAGHAVTYCRCGAQDAPEFSFPAGEIHEVAAGQGCRVVDVPVTIPIETEPRVGLELSYHLDRYLARRPYTDVIFPDAFGVGFYAMLAKNLGLRHRATTLSLLLLGARRDVMSDRSLYPTLEDVAAFHREERCLALADRVLAVSGHQLVDADPSRAFLAPLWDSDATRLAPFAAAGHDYLCLTGLPEVEDVRVAARAIADALSGTDQRSAAPRIHFLQWGQPHTDAQVAGIFRGLAGCRAEVSLDWFVRGQVMPVLAAAGQVIVPAPAADATALLRLAFASGARVLVQEST